MLIKALFVQLIFATPANASGSSYYSALLHIYYDIQQRDWSFGKSSIPPQITIRSLSRLEFQNHSWRLNGALTASGREVTFSYQIRFYSADYYVRSINATIPGPEKNTNYQILVSDNVFPSGHRYTVTVKRLSDHRPEQYLFGRSKTLFASRLTQFFNDQGILTYQSGSLSSLEFDKGSAFTYTLNSNGEVLSTQVTQSRWGRNVDISGLIEGAASGEIQPDFIGEGLLPLDNPNMQHYPVSQHELCTETDKTSICKEMVAFLSNNGKGQISYFMSSNAASRAVAKEAGIEIEVSASAESGLDASNGLSLGLSLQQGGSLNTQALEVQLNDTAGKRGRFLVSYPSINLTTYTLRAYNLSSADPGFNLASIKSITVLGHSPGIMTTHPVTGEGWAVVNVLVSPYSFSTAAYGDVTTSRGVPVQFEIIKEDGAPYTFESAEAIPTAKKGLLQIAPNLQTLTYTPDSDFSGQESFPLTNTCLNEIGEITECMPGSFSIRVDSDPFSTSSDEFSASNPLVGLSTDGPVGRAPSMNDFPRGPKVIPDMEITQLAFDAARIMSDGFNAGDVNFGDSASFPIKTNLPITQSVGARGVSNSLTTVPVTGKASVSVEWRDGNKTFIVGVILNGRDEQEITSGKRTVGVEVFRNLTIIGKAFGGLERTEGSGSASLREHLAYKKGYKQQNTKISGKQSIDINTIGVLYGFQVDSLSVDKNIKEETNSTGKPIDTSWKTSLTQLAVNYENGEPGTSDGFDRTDYRGPNPGVSLAPGTPAVNMLGESYTFQRFENSQLPTVDENKGNAYLFKSGLPEPYGIRAGRAKSGDVINREIDGAGTVLKDENDGGYETKYENYVEGIYNQYDNKRNASKKIFDPQRKLLVPVLNYSYGLNSSRTSDPTYGFLSESAAIIVSSDEVVGGEVIRNWRMANGGRSAGYGISDNVYYNTKIYDLTGIGIDDTGGPKFEHSFSRNTEYNTNNKPHSISGSYSFYQDGERLDLRCAVFVWGSPPSAPTTVFGRAYPELPFPASPSDINQKISALQAKQGSAGDGIKVFVPDRYPKVGVGFFHQPLGHACGII